MTEMNGFPSRLCIVDVDSEDEVLVADDSPSFPARVGGFHDAEDGVNTKLQFRISVSFDSDSDSENSRLPSEAVHCEKSPSEPDTGSGLVVRCRAGGDVTRGKQTADEEEGDIQILPDDDEAVEDVHAKDQKSTPEPALVRSSVVTTPPATPLASPDASPPPSPQTIPSPRNSHRLAVLSSSPSSPKSPGRKLEFGTPDRPLWIGATRRRSSHEDNVVKSPLAGPFRAIRARAFAAYKANAPEPNMGGEEWLQEDGSSSEESSQGDDFISTDEESGTFDDIVDDDDTEKDFTAIVPMPNSFLDLPPDRFDFLDRDLVESIRDQKLSTFALEHNLFAKGLMQLLAERDAVGVEDDIHDSSNVIKMGPLKKRTTRGKWPVKYVEIRRGNLSYFADDAKRIGSMHRKTIHLRKRTCCCTPVSEANSNDDIFVFDLMVEGRPKIQFMAKSEEERQGWIRAICQAMIGDVEGSQQDTPVDLSIYQSAIDSYRTVSGALKQVESRADFLIAVDSLLYRKTPSSALRLPMSWLREEVIEHRESEQDDDSPDARVKLNIAENWKCLSKSSVKINGYLIEQNTSYSANRMLGTLARCILEHDRVEAGEDDVHTLKRNGKYGLTGMTELEAVSYARSILVSALRSDHYGHITKAVEHLVQNERVANAEFVKSDPLRIDVSFAGEDYMEREQKPNDMSGWLLTRPKEARAWKNRYFVVSEGVLSFFAEADPRPYGLRGQIVLNKCTMKTLDDNILSLEIEEEERCLQFQDRGQLLKWRAVLERAADSESALVQRPRPPKKGKRGPIASTVNPLKSATDTGVKVGKRAMRVMKEAPKAGLKKARGMLANIRQRGQTTRDDDRRNTTEAMLMMSTRGFPSYGEKKDLKVHAVTEHNSVFRVMPVSAQVGSDPLLMIHVKLYQAFVLSGGSNGRLYRGDELIEMEFFGMEEDGDRVFLEAPTLL